MLVCRGNTLLCVAAGHALALAGNEEENWLRGLVVRRFAPDSQRKPRDSGTSAPLATASARYHRHRRVGLRAALAGSAHLSVESRALRFVTHTALRLRRARVDESAPTTSPRELPITG